MKCLKCPPSSPLSPLLHPARSVGCLICFFHLISSLSESPPTPPFLRPSAVPPCRRSFYSPSLLASSNPLTLTPPPLSFYRYNDERPPSDEDDADSGSGSESDSVGSSKAENIYEEIADGVRSRIGSGDGGGGRGRGGTGGGGGGGGSGTSLNSDSGVGNGSNNGSGGSGSGGGADRVNRRKFSSETLDFGPKSTHGRKISR